MFFFNQIPSIKAAELEKHLSDRPQIIDVRELNEFKSGHIPGAKNIPLKKIDNYTPKGKTYIICQSGMRSKKASKLLKDKGYDIVNVKGGMSAWSGTVRGGKI